MVEERKIRELLGKLVAMSPEPPPYPEQSMVVAPVAPPRARPILMFAGAALVVLALAIPIVLLTNNGGSNEVAPTLPVPGSTTTTQQDATSTTGQTGTTDQPNTSTTVAVGPWTGVVYLTAEAGNSYTGNPGLVPVPIGVAGVDTDAPFTAALTAVANAGASLPPGMGNAIPQDVEIVSLATDGDLITADMNESFRLGAGGLLADVTMLNQMVYTLTQGNGQARVLFTIGGEPVLDYGSEGIDLSGTVGRSDYIDQLNLIFLTEPVVNRPDSVLNAFQHEDPNPGYWVVGVANAYEAMLAVRVVDDGSVVYEETVQATCGTGCWGEFGMDIDPELVTPGVSVVEVFQYSAEDGSPSNVITVPIPEGTYWELVPATG